MALAITAQALSFLGYILFSFSSTAAFCVSTSLRICRSFSRRSAYRYARLVTLRAPEPMPLLA